MKTYAQAQAYAEHQRVSGNPIWFNLCQKFVRSCVGAAAWGTSARAAANSVPLKERHYTTPPPAGAQVFYGSSTHGNGHVALAASKYGYVYSNDIKRRARVDLVPWNVFSSAWGYPFRFWTTWTPSGRVQLAPTPQLPALIPNTVIPTISLRRVQAAAAADPKASQGHKTYPNEVILVERALQKAGYLAAKYIDGSFGTLTIKAYSGWQRHLGYSGKDANGIPGATSLTALGKKYGFRVSR